MEKELFERILILMIQYKKANWGENWGDVKKPPKIELLSYFSDPESPFINVSYRINDFITIMDAIPNFNYKPDGWDKATPNLKEVVTALTMFDDDEIIRRLNEGIE